MRPADNRLAAPQTRTEESRPSEPIGGDDLSCGGCGKALTAAQKHLSVRNFGRALCPACQKAHREDTRTDRREMATQGPAARIDEPGDAADSDPFAET